MRVKLTFILILLNAILVGSLIYLDHKQDSEQAYDAQNSLVLPLGLVDKTTQINIEGENALNNWSLEKDSNENWRITQPISWPANTYAVSRILDQLKSLEWETSFSIEDLEKSGQSLADYGLEHPQATLSLHAGDQTVRIRMGQSTKIGNRIYILSPDSNSVYVINQSLFDAISVDMQNLRNPAIFDIPLYETRALSIQAGDANAIRVLLSRRGHDWVFEAPIRTGADPLRVETYLNALLSGEAVSFVGTDLAKQQLDTPSARIAVEGNNRRQVLILGSSFLNANGEKLTYARRNDSESIFTIPSRILEPLLNAQETLRERKFNYFDIKQITALDISSGDQSTHLQKLETGKWQIRKNGDALASWDVDADIIKNLLNRLAYMEAERFVSDAPAEADLTTFGFDSPQRTVNLKFKDKDLNHTVYFGNYRKGKDTVYAKLNSAVYVYEVPMSILRILDLDSLNYRDRVLDALPASARVTKISITSIPENKTVISLGLPNETSEWNSILNGYSAEQQEAILGLIEDLKQFKVRSYVNDTFKLPLKTETDAEAHWDYSLTAEIYLPGTNENNKKTATYLFTKRLGGSTQFGGSESQNVTFKITQKMVDHLYVLLEKELPTPPTIEQPKPIQQEK
jgi:hypothetical protein